MTQREIAALICKSLGIYAFINALNGLPSLLLPLLGNLANAQAGGPSMPIAVRLGMFINALPFMLMLFAGVVLWVGAESIAALMVKNSDETTVPIVTGKEAQIVVFSALGLWTLVQAVPRVAQAFLKIMQFATQDMLARTDAAGMSAPEIGALLVQVGLGVGLLLGARSLAGALKSFPDELDGGREGE
jgi:hypothetical protein